MVRARGGGSEEETKPKFVWIKYLPRHLQGSF